MSKKIFAAVCVAALFATMAFAEDGTISYENTVSSDIVNITTGDSGKTEFAGIEDEVVVDFTTERFDAGIDVSLYLDDESFGYPKAELGDYTIVALNDWYIEFRPFQMLTLGLNDTVNTPASYLPVLDDNSSNGNLGSDMVVVLRPIEGLRIGAGLDTIWDFDDKPVLNFGADFVAEKFSAGVTFRNVMNDFAMGIFGGFTGVDGLTINAGFSMNEANVLSGNVMMASVAYEADAWNCAGEAAYALEDKDEGNPAVIYAAGTFGYQITDAFGASATVTYTKAIADDVKAEISFEPDVVFTFGNSEISAGINITVSDSTAICFPVYWSYSL